MEELQEALKGLNFAPVHEHDERGLKAIGAPSRCELISPRRAEWPALFKPFLKSGRELAPRTMYYWLAKEIERNHLGQEWEPIHLCQLLAIVPLKHLKPAPFFRK